MKQLFMLIFALFLNSCGKDCISYKEISQRTDSSKDIVKEFSKQLKGKLQSAMKSGGPIKAITVCNEQAPLIAHQLSAKTGWDIHRTSLKARATKPDAWETQILQSFEQRHADGDKFKSLFNQDVVEVNNKSSFRYIQAIKTQEICLVCHGENIAPDIAAKISQLYPNDKAIGFKEGAIRGAFSVIQPLN